MANKDVVPAVCAWMLENGHRALLMLTGGRWPNRVAGMPTLELHVTGRTSGERRSTLLTAPIIDGETIVIVASKGGHSQHPQWYKNLVVNPDVEITIDGGTKRMVARTATGVEREALWQRITKDFKNYAGYQRSTDREIPVVVCEPARAVGS
ncbi:MAG: nitroreductase/quinone reductase family protein [Microthrixaceae bacterium]